MMRNLTLILLALVPLASTAGAANTSFASNSIYNAWLQHSSAGYKNVLYVPSDNQVNGVMVHWTISDDNTTLELAVAVEAEGWMGFGFSENGGMTGSDMMIYETANPGVVLDAYVTQVRSPQIDDCADWNFVNATVDNGTMVVEVSRKLSTGDTQDLPILDDSSFTFPVHRIISAWGDTETYSFHGMNRARGTIRWFAGDATEAELFTAVMAPYANNTISVFAVNHEIKPVDTEYAYVCVNGNGLRDQGVDLDNGVTLVGMEAIITTPHVHHFVGYASYSENNDNDACNMTDYYQMTYLWAPGEPPRAFPDFLGMPLGGANGFRSFRLEFHYNNPNLTEGIIDNSGLIYYYSEEPREQTLGIMQVGDPFIGLYGYPIADGTTSYIFDCPSSCTTSLLEKPVTVIWEYLHMHQSGVSQYSQQYRDGNLIRSSKAEYFDFTQQGGQAVLQGPFEVHPGDSFSIGCFYENAPGTNRTFGLGSSNEMCISFLYYYPAVSGGLPFACGVGLTAYLPNCDIAAAGISITDDATQELASERVFGTAPAGGQCPSENADASEAAKHIMVSSLVLLFSAVAMIAV